MLLLEAIKEATVSDLRDFSDAVCRIAFNFIVSRSPAFHSIHDDDDDGGDDDDDDDDLDDDGDNNH